MSTVQDTDLLLINRAGVDYKCTFLDWKNSQSKAPDVGAVTLADVAGGSRFTSVAFPVSATMTENGIPASTKKLKAYVEGTLKTAAQTSGIASVAGNVLTLTDNTQLTNFAPGDAITEVTSTGTAGDATGTVGAVDAVAKTITLSATAGTWDVGSAVKGPLKTQMVTVTPNSDVITAVGASSLTFATAKDLAYFAAGDHVNNGGVSPALFGEFYTNGVPEAGYPKANSTLRFTDAPVFSKTSTAYQPIADHVNAALPDYSEHLIFDMINSSTELTVKWSGGSWKAFHAPALNGPWTQFVGLTAGPNTTETIRKYIGSSRYVAFSYADFAGGTSPWHTTYGFNVQLSTAWINAYSAMGAYDYASGLVAGVNAATNTMTLTGISGTWLNGQTARTITKSTPVANVKLYCKLDAAGAVSDLQSADPGFTAWTPAGTGPYTGTVTFPATLPSGADPDTDLPAGTSLTVEVEASNTSGSDSAKSSTVVPV